MPDRIKLKYKDGMEFTRRWFINRDLATFSQFIYPEYHNKPVTYLELGVYEGMSMCWMLQNVLTHRKARAIGVDPWLMMPKITSEKIEEIRKRAWNNVQCCLGETAHTEGDWYLKTSKCQLYRSSSSEFLLSCMPRRPRRNRMVPLTQESVDICMIDGVHWAPFVAYDAKWSYHVVKPGGMLLFDDVENDREKGAGHVKDGIKMWLEELGPGKVEKVFKHRYMEGYRKL